MPVVGTNIAANTAVRYLNSNSATAAGSVGKIASGSRIVKASDDAAGLAIGTRLSADVTVLKQSSVNASQGASLVQVADGGLARISDVLQRMKALAAQSLSGVPSDTERGFINAEFSQLITELDGIAGTTRFNGSSLLNTASGQFSGSVNFFVGTAVGDNIAVNMTTLSGITTYTSAGLGVSAASVSTATLAATAMGLVDTAINSVSNARATAGALISRFEFRGEQIATSMENIDAARSSTMDVDIAAEQSALVSAQVLVQASVSALSQANQLPQALLRVLQ